MLISDLSKIFSRHKDVIKEMELKEGDKCVIIAFIYCVHVLAHIRSGRKKLIEYLIKGWGRVMHTSCTSLNYGTQLNFSLPLQAIFSLSFYKKNSPNTFFYKAIWCVINDRLHWDSNKKHTRRLCFPFTYLLNFTLQNKLK